MLNDPRSSEWGSLALPDWVKEFRATQVTAIEAILSRFEAGARIVVLDAPTGSGKTLIGEVVRRLLKQPALYVCSDRGLQDQFLRDFEYARLLKGRRNYPTLDYPERFESEDRLSCDDCTAVTRKRCRWCSDYDACPYKVAKQRALAAPLACLNTAYFLSEANGPGGFGDEDLVIVDECDRLEETLMSHVSLNITGRRLADWGISALHKDADSIAALEWVAERVLPMVEEDLERLGPAHEDDHQSIVRRRRALENLQYKLGVIADGIVGGGWVWMPFPGEIMGVTFKPVRVDGMAEQMLWAHADRWLLMSATVLNPARMLKDLGITEGWSVVRMPSPFPVANRPIHAKSVASVTKAAEDDAAPKLIAAVRGIMALHPKERILVHTVSFRLLNRLKAALGEDQRTVWYQGAESRGAVLQDYLSRRAGVLFAPAMDRGVDLPDDACRVVVVCKMPFGDLGDVQVKARINSPGGRDWYADNTLRSLVQMTGRGVRHAEDYCVSYILDAQFDRMLAQYRSRLPGWWVEAVR